MYTRYEAVLARFGAMPAYLFMKAITHTLSVEDCVMAQSAPHDAWKCNMVRVIGGWLGEVPDTEFLAKEAVLMISTDMEWNIDDMFNAFGFVWDTDPEDEFEFDENYVDGCDKEGCNKEGCDD